MTNNEGPRVIYKEIKLRERQVTGKHRELLQINHRIRNKIVRWLTTVITNIEYKYKPTLNNSIFFIN